MKAGNFVVVLVGPRRQGNVGSAARAMKNCGITRLRIVGGRKFGKEAKRFAVHAEDVLRDAQRFESLEEAVTDAVRIVGFSSKKYRLAPRAASLPAVAGALREASDRGLVALVFGREDHGLLNPEIRLCTDLVKIPTDAGYPVLNLAQSVLLAGYEIALAPQRKSPARAVSTAAQLPRGRRQLLLAGFSELLERLAYADPAGRNRSARILQRLSAQFGRALEEEADLQLWMGLLKRLKQRV